METQHAELPVLIDLGLTLIQAKVYLALVESGPLKVTAISEISKVARPDIYRTLLKLHKIGLVEKIVKNPIQYRAAPITTVLRFLLENKTKRYRSVRAETQVMLNELKTKQNKPCQIDNSDFVLIPRGIAIKRIQNAIEKAQLSIDFILPWKMFSGGLVDIFTESLEIAWAKTVKIRFLTENPVKTETAEKLIQFYLEKPSCHLRFINHYPRIVFGLFDKEEVFLTVNPEMALLHFQALWSNNHSLVALAEEYFDMMWQNQNKV